jgi:hypothetical protein
MVVQGYNPRTNKVETGGSEVWGQPWLHSEFQASLSYIEKPYLKKTKNNKKTAFSKA